MPLHERYLRSARETLRLANDVAGAVTLVVAVVAALKADSARDFVGDGLLYAGAWSVFFWGLYGLLLVFYDPQFVEKPPPKELKPLLFAGAAVLAVTYIASVPRGQLAEDIGVGPIWLQAIGGIASAWYAYYGLTLVRRFALAADAHEGETGEPQKRCPDCAELVLAQARVCKHCGYRFDADQAAHTP